MDYFALGKRIRKRRVEQGMTQEQLALHVGVTTSFIGHLERGSRKASLETLSFMPLLQTDSNGGVIVTDWYANPRNPAERMKVSVTILDQDLRADALRVAASRQVAVGGGTWVDAPVEAATVQKLEDIILTKARELRRSAIAG